MAKNLSKSKAAEMLHNPPHGKPLTEKQRKYFGAIANAQKGKTLPPLYTEDPRKVQDYQDSLTAYQRDVNFDKEFVNFVKHNKFATEEERKKISSKYPYNKIKPQVTYELNSSPILYTSPSGYKVRDLEIYKKPQQPYILQQNTPQASVETYIDDEGVTHQSIGLRMPPKKGEKQPTLPRSKYTPNKIQTTPGQTQLIPASGQRPVLGNIPNLPYRVEYYDGDTKGMTHQNFPGEKEGSEFMKELQNRPYGIPYGVQGYYENAPKKKNGGWLDKYDDGGNANDGHSSGEANWMGEGYTTKGFDYNSAWGGQFAMGGQIPQAQKGLKCPTNVCGPGDTGEQTGVGRLIGNIGDFLGVGHGDERKERRGERRMLRNERRQDDLTPITRNYGHQIEGEFDDNYNNIFSGFNLNNDAFSRMNLTGFINQDYIDPSYMPWRTFDSQATPTFAPEQKTSPLYNDGIVSRYTSPEANTPGNIINSGRDFSGVPVSGMAAMGGSIPGSVGFTYARTGSTPSEGPYAKKTMPSAQNGMTFYQHGLDWTPRNISKNGGWLDKYDVPQAQFGESILKGLGELKDYVVGLFSDDPEPVVKKAPIEQGLSNEFLSQQAWKESQGDPNAVSPRGYKGLTQVGDDVIEDYKKKTGNVNVNPFNPSDAVKIQRYAMNNLYNADFINKPNQSDQVRLAKTLAAYNWGRGNLSNYLNKSKEQGVDIYNSLDWMKGLPPETSDYISKILLKKDKKFSESYKQAVKNPKYKKVFELYGLNKKKDGGIVKDDNGYWNPDNWGKTVEIGSPDITMEGVNEPLIGESKQTGEKKMMLPGQNYKFANTKQVIEKPLNKKSTKGWLDKYN